MGLHPINQYLTSIPHIAPTEGQNSPCQLSYLKVNPQPLAALLTMAAMYILPGPSPDALFLLHEMINYVVSFCLSDRR